MKVKTIFESKDECKAAYEKNRDDEEASNQQELAIQNWKRDHKIRARATSVAEVLVGLLLFYLIPVKITKNVYLKVLYAPTLSIEAIGRIFIIALVLFFVFCVIMEMLSLLLRKLNLKAPIIKELSPSDTQYYLQYTRAKRYKTFLIVKPLLAESESAIAITFAVSQGFSVIPGHDNESGNAIFDFDKSLIILPNGEASEKEVDTLEGAK